MTSVLFMWNKSRIIPILLTWTNQISYTCCQELNFLFNPFCNLSLVLNINTRICQIGRTAAPAYHRVYTTTEGRRLKSHNGSSSHLLAPKYRVGRSSLKDIAYCKKSWWSTSLIEITKVNFLEQDQEFYSLPSALVLVPASDSALPS